MYVVIRFIYAYMLLLYEHAAVNCSLYLDVILGPICINVVVLSDHYIFMLLLSDQDFVVKSPLYLFLALYAWILLLSDHYNFMLLLWPIYLDFVV